LAKNRGKSRRVKKVSDWSVNCVERLKKQPNFYAREGEVKSTYYSNQSIILLVYKKVHFNINEFNPYTLSFVFLCCKSLMICFLMRFLVDCYQ
jgi:hypothetical protein